MPILAQIGPALAKVDKFGQKWMRNIPESVQHGHLEHVVPIWANLDQNCHILPKYAHFCQLLPTLAQPRARCSTPNPNILST